MTSNHFHQVISDTSSVSHAPGDGSIAAALNLSKSSVELFLLQCSLCHSAQEKGWTSKKTKPTRKQKGGSKGDFQLVFAEDIKEHLDVFDFQTRHGGFCDKSDKLTKGQLTLKNHLKLKTTIKQHLTPGNSKTREGTRKKAKESGKHQSDQQ